ncbi:MAG: filamentous hemagglutinin N-terminal domain-containing protein [Gammaproteobacteria bacterium]|nr:filamentous hemagglutinin N-terminal domain-containing protein [Gammaproteobacteria bacterium]
MTNVPSDFNRKPLAVRIASSYGTRIGWGALASLPGLVLAGPSGEQLVAGNASVVRPDAFTTQVNQQSQSAVMNWQTFSVDGNEYVIFNQPGTSSTILNRIVGQDASEILGRITANGQVFLVNPNGVYFGPDAQVDVGALVASIQDIGSDEFMAGNYVLVRPDDAPDGASVINAGTINSGENGYIVLAGDYVENSGVITGRLGTVVLASGRKMTLELGAGGLVDFAVDEEIVSELAGVQNLGAISADGGRVLMTAKVAEGLVATAVNNEGLVRAQSIVEQDGAIFLRGTGGDVVQAGTLDASGAEGQQGGRVVITSTDDIAVRTGSDIEAGGDGSAAGGQVRIVAQGRMDFQQGAAINAEAGVDGGVGGQVEVSGHGSLALNGDIAVGDGGQVVIDPGRLEILNNANAPSVSYGTTSVGQVGKGFIETQLNAGVDITLFASSVIANGSSPSNFAINATGAGNLTLAIGSTSFNTPSGSLGSVAGSYGGGCSFVGICSPGSFYVFNPGTTGDIALSGINFFIAGDLTVKAGTANGNIAIGILQGTGVDVHGGSASGTVNTADITVSGVGTVSVSGHDTLGVGNITAGGNVTINGASHVTVGNVNTTGNLAVVAGSGGTGNATLGAVVANGGITLNGGSTFGMVNANALTASGGGIVVGGHDGIGITNNVSAQSVVLTASNGNVDTGNITATAGAINVVGVAGIQVGNVSATTNASFMASGGDLTLGDATVGGHLGLDVINSTLIIQGGNLTAGDIAASGVNAFNAGNLQATTSNIVLSGFGAVNVGNMNAVSNVAIAGATTISAGAVNGAVVDLLATTSVGVAGAISGGDVTLEAANGNVTTAGINISGLLDVVAGSGDGTGDISLGNTQAAAVFLEAGTTTGVISAPAITATAGSIIFNAGTAANIPSLSATGGNIQFSGLTTVTGGSIVTDGVIGASSVGTFNATSMNAGSDIIIGALSGIALSGATVASGQVSLTTPAGNITAGNITSGSAQQIVVNAGAGDVTLGNLAGGDISVVAPGGAISLGNLAINGQFLLTAADDLVIGNVSAQDSLQLTTTAGSLTTGILSVSGPGDALLTLTTPAGESITVNGGISAIAGEGDANIIISAGADLTVAPGGVVAEGSGDAVIDITAAGVVDIAGRVDADAQGFGIGEVNIVADSVTAGDDIVASAESDNNATVRVFAAGDIMVAGSVAAGTPADGLIYMDGHHITIGNTVGVASDASVEGIVPAGNATIWLFGDTFSSDGAGGVTVHGPVVAVAGNANTAGNVAVEIRGDTVTLTDTVSSPSIGSDSIPTRGVLLKAGGGGNADLNLSGHDQLTVNGATVIVADGGNARADFGSPTLISAVEVNGNVTVTGSRAEVRVVGFDVVVNGDVIANASTNIAEIIVSGFVEGQGNPGDVQTNGTLTANAQGAGAEAGIWLAGASVTVNGDAMAVSEQDAWFSASAETVTVNGDVAVDATGGSGGVWISAGTIEINGAVAARGSSFADISFGAEDIQTNGTLTTLATNGGTRIELYAASIESTGGPVEVNGAVRAETTGAGASASVFMYGSSVTLNASTTVATASGEGSTFYTSGSTVTFNAGVSTGLNGFIGVNGNTLTGTGVLAGDNVSVFARQTVNLKTAAETLSILSSGAGASSVMVDNSSHTGSASAFVEGSAPGGVEILNGGNLDISISFLDAGFFKAVSMTGNLFIDGNLTVGSNALAATSADQFLFDTLEANGLVPPAHGANIYLSAPGGITVESIEFTNSTPFSKFYSNDQIVIGDVSGPTGADYLVVYSLLNPELSIQIEDAFFEPAAGVVGFNNTDNFAVWPGTTIVFGEASADAGAAMNADITIGQNGTIDIGSQNFLVYTRGSVVGLENLISTGVIAGAEPAEDFQIPIVNEFDQNTDGDDGEDDDDDTLQGVVAGSGGDNESEISEETSSGQLECSA